MTKPIKVLIADDHAIVRMGLTTLLNNNPSFTVVGEADDGETAVREALRLKPDVIVMDLAMPEKDGTTATAELRANGSSAKILILTSFGTSEELTRALAAGADGALLKSAANAELMSTIKEIAAGKHVVSEAIEQMMVLDPPLPELSNRQREILMAVAQGRTSKQIATRLDISVESINTHINAILAKLGAANRSEAVAIALRKHLLKI